VPAPAAAAAADTARVIAGEYESEHGVRSYRLYVPAGPGRTARPLVVMLHGCAQTAAELATAGRLDSLGAEFGALVLLPEQPATANPLRCWNWFVPAHQARDAGEPAIIAGLTRHIAREHGADAERVVLGGLSAGGAMAVLTGLAYPDLYAAIGTHSGVGWRVAGDVPGAFAAMRGGGVDAAAQARAAHAAMGARARVVPVIAIHGAADTVAHPTATDGLVAQLAALHRLVAPGAELRADTSRMEAGGYPVEVRRYTAGGRVVLEHWVVAGLAHALSGGDSAARWTDARGPDAAREMLRFMLSHRHE
jgi:poly(hydroxyalkanoate) depolymerase family esterase